MFYSRIFGVPLFLASAISIVSLQAEAPKVLWSHSRGLVNEPFQLTLATEPMGATIFYTTDGSVPSIFSGETYTEPLRIDETTILRVVASNDTGSAPVETRSFLFVHQVEDQEAFPEGYITEIISARNGSRRPHTFDWAMDPEVVNNTANNGDLTAHLKEIPTLSVVMSVDDFNYVYKNHRRRGSAYERAASLELIYPDKEAYAGFDGFQIDCGLRMQGGGAVDQARKKSFRILFKKEYGQGSLNYPLFESAVHFGGSAASTFEGVILRAGGNTNWSKDDAWKHEPSTYLRDSLARDSQVAISGMGSRSVFVHCYLNGFYFGLYNIAERPDNKFMSAYFGGEVEDYYSINHGGTVDGDPDRWNESISSSSLNYLHEADRYDAIRERIDIEAFSDYILLNWLVGMGDWPHNNFYAGVRNQPAGKILYFNWDSEYAFWTLEGYLGSNPTGWVHPSFRTRGNTLPRIWNALAANDDFLMTFADRVYRHCFNAGPLTDINMKARFQRLASAIENAIVAESARWGDSAWGRENNPHTKANTFIPNRDAVLKLIDGNVDIFIAALRAERFYPELDPPVLPPSQDTFDSGLAITMTNPNGAGAIYFTLNGTDPRLPGGKVSPVAVIYDSESPPSVITKATRAKARVMRTSLFGGSEWSPLNEQLYLAAPVGFPLRVTELMYHPKEIEALEFIELQNVSLASLDLTGFYFRGIDYRFPPGSRLEAKHIIVLIPNDDPEAFSEAYPGVKIFGTYRRHLANDGEEIRILDGYDRLITSVTFDDDTETGWPASADGGGRSLEVLDPLTAGMEMNHWRASAALGGTPGEVAPVMRTDLDSDKDGFSDESEVKAGTDPNDPTSFLRLEVERLDDDTFRLRFNSQTGRAYAVQSRGVINHGDWQLVREFPSEDAASTVTIDEAISNASGHMFFRLVVK